MNQPRKREIKGHRWNTDETPMSQCFVNPVLPLCSKRAGRLPFALELRLSVAVIQLEIGNDVLNGDAAGGKLRSEGRKGRQKGTFWFSLEAECRFFHSLVTAVSSIG
jgi:hypothetical protein